VPAGRAVSRGSRWRRGGSAPVRPIRSPATWSCRTGRRWTSSTCQRPGVSPELPARRPTD